MPAFRPVDSMPACSDVVSGPARTRRHKPDQDEPIPLSASIR
jgi:hypothetical protein